MPSARRQPPRGTRESVGDGKGAPKRYEGGRACTVCGVALSAYNAGPQCWRHSIGMPWRGPSAKPKYDESR